MTCPAFDDCRRASLTAQAERPRRHIRASPVTSSVLGIGCFPDVADGRIVWRLEEKQNESIPNSVLGGSNSAGPGQSTAIANVLQQVLSQDGGGVATLISRFTDAGLGDHVHHG